jgi:RNA polymerase sigma factor (sigma-70 family)
MHGSALHESLARDRVRYERLLFARMGGTITREDAEDIVSDALLKVAAKAETDAPEVGSEEAWFGRVVLNQGIDFIRARDGRRRNGSNGRPKVVSLRDLDEDANALSATDDDPALDDAAEREQAQAVVTRVMSALDPKDAELVKLRHLVGPAASREQLATMAGLTVGEFRWRYTRAWNRFVDAVAGDAPTARCVHIRELLGDLGDGIAAPEVVAEIDAHTLDCVSCRVFARESYRALELLPFAPVITAAERWSARVGWWWDRSNPEVATGAGAATGAGLWALLGGSGAGLVKVVAIVCSATAVTAGLCAGVVAVLDDPPAPRQAAKPKMRPAAQATPTPTPVRTATPAAARKRAPAPTPKKKRPTPDLSGEKEIPANAPAGASEFKPSASGASLDPAPAPPAGGGEFTP